MPAPKPDRSPAAERLFAVVVRTLHLAAVVALGAALHGAPIATAGTAVAAVASGAVLAAMDLAAGRIRATELAGIVVAIKLGVVAWIGLAGARPEVALAAFWALLVASSFSAHAPKALRHWRPRARARSAGRPG